MARHTAKTEQIREHVDYVESLQLARDPDRQALACELVDHVQHPVLAPVVGAMLDEVIGPDVVGPLRPQSQARAVVEPEARPLWLASGNLEPLSPPDPFDLLHVHRPTLTPEHRRDPLAL